MLTIDPSTVYRLAYGDASVTPFAFQRAVAETADADVRADGSREDGGGDARLAWRRLTMPAATPRRLIWCLPMRTLVEQTAANAQRRMGRLAELFRKSGQCLPDVHVAIGRRSGG
jgi:CRISPR-associated endonuclease/helicase Cas3